jgi:hypothetical protein
MPYIALSEFFAQFDAAKEAFLPLRIEMLYSTTQKTGVFLLACS